MEKKLSSLHYTVGFVAGCTIVKLLYPGITKNSFISQDKRSLGMSQKLCIWTFLFHMSLISMELKILRYIYKPKFRLIIRKKSEFKRSCESRTMEKLIN